MFIWAIGLTAALFAIVGVRAGVVTEELKVEVRRWLMDLGKNSEEIDEMLYGSKDLKFVREGYSHDNIVRIAKDLKPDSPLLARQQRWYQYMWGVIIVGACIIGGSIVIDMLSRW
jgi:hypothetical protein